MIKKFFKFEKKEFLFQIKFPRALYTESLKKIKQSKLKDKIITNIYEKNKTRIDEEEIKAKMDLFKFKSIFVKFNFLFLIIPGLLTYFYLRKKTLYSKEFTDSYNVLVNIGMFNNLFFVYLIYIE